MNDGLVLDIEDIQIIVHKTEEANFTYNNPKRSYDGFVMITSGVGYAIKGDEKNTAYRQAI